MNKRSIFKIFFISLAILSLSNCKKVSTPLEPQRNPVDYVFLIDNSGSIPAGDARDIAREVLKFFVDFAEEGDKVSIIRFDESAGIVVNKEINIEEDRIYIKSSIDDEGSGINFKGRFTDISKGILFLKENSISFFRGGDVVPIVILLSDGKLEPKNPSDTRSAFDLICRLLTETDLNIIPFYTIGIGNTGIYEEFLKINGESFNGERLLKEKISLPTGGYFHHAKRVDDLLDIFVDILKVTKKAPEIRKGHVLDVDKAIERISMIVAKRGENQQYCQSNDLVLIDPEGYRIKYSKKPESIKWYGASPYYDLIVIEKPHIGQWLIKSTSGINPPVISIMKTWLTLAYDVNTLYFENEQKIISAWVKDNRRGKVSKESYTVMAKFDKEDRFTNSYNFIRLRKDQEEKYSSEINVTAVGNYRMQIVAENKEIFFRRTSEPIDIRIEPERIKFVDVSKNSPYINKFGWDGVSIGAIINRDILDFERPPEVRFFLAVKDKRKIENIIPLTWQFDENRISYASLLKFNPGDYRGYYNVAGTLKNGERINIRSPHYRFVIKWWWPWRALICLSIAGVFLLIGWIFRKPEKKILFPKVEIIIVSFLLFISIFGLWRDDMFTPSFLIIIVASLYMAFWLIVWKSEILHPRLEGKLIFKKPEPKTIDLRSEKFLKPRMLGRFGQFVESNSIIHDLKDVSFRLYSIVESRKKVIKLERLRGTITINEKRVIAPKNIYHGNIIKFTDTGRQYEIEFSNVRMISKL